MATQEASREHHKACTSVTLALSYQMRACNVMALTCILAIWRHAWPHHPSVQATVEACKTSSQVDKSYIRQSYITTMYLRPQYPTHVLIIVY